MEKNNSKPLIPYARQSINQDDIDAVIAILKSDLLTQGPTIPLFEQACANYCHAQYATACNSATSALHIACLAMDLGKGDILWTSPNTFVASSNCALYCGASVDFVDIDPKTYNICPLALERKLIDAKKVKKLPKVVVAVHYAGQSCDMKSIKLLADEYGFKLIEDASHAIGGMYDNEKIGSCQYSDLTVFSFHPVKIITSGEGGMIVTNSAKIKQKSDLFRMHGITRNPTEFKYDNQGAWYYEQIGLGYNYRMTDIHAALGLNQLKRINMFVNKRRIIADYYHKALANLPVITPYESSDCHSAYHLYPIQIKIGEANISRKTVFDAMRQAGIYVNVHYIPVHTQPYYQQLGFKKGDYPQAENFYERMISLPMYYDLNTQDQIYVIEILKNILGTSDPNKNSVLQPEKLVR